jgi:hypothetical protein
MRKLLLSITSVMLVCLISGFITLHSQQQERPWQHEVATPVTEDELTPQQREHSKLYELYGGRDKIRDSLLKKQPRWSLQKRPCVVT